MEVCKICGKSFSRLATHLTKSHSVSMEEYRKLYNDSTLVSEVSVHKSDDIDYDISFNAPESNVGSDTPVNQTTEESSTTPTLTTSQQEKLEEYRKMYNNSTPVNKVDILKDDDIDFSNYPNNVEISTLPPTNQINSVPDNTPTLTASQQEKETVLDLIKEKYSDAEKDHFINLGLRGVLAVDFASPLEKIVFNFPNAFWHNQNLYFNEKVLNDNKWKVFNYYSLQDFVEEFSN